MGNISLRAYSKQIENLIENNKNDAAIHHCKHILLTYPKHLETYRLLAKAYLELQRYADALDILQRILSVVPDDFIAHIGMSIIREDESNFDAAIWHMERAFDIQPSNNAVQEELIRLIGKRDGTEPAKIRLTRGALVRMYLRGNLFTQAIAEARAALKDDPTRLDLQVVLARAYHLAGMKAEAVEIANQMLTSMPYCLESHRVITANPKLVSNEDLSASHQTLLELDPYYEFISTVNTSVEQIPDNSVLIEEAEGAENAPAPYEVLAAQSDVAPSPVQDFYDTEKATATADEAGSIFSGNAEFSDEVADLESPNEDTEKIVPDWMKDAGWLPGDTQAGTPPPEVFSEDESKPLAAAEIPDWLKSMAPPEEDNLQRDDSMTQEDDFSALFADQKKDTAAEESFAQPDETNVFTNLQAEPLENQPFSAENLYGKEQTEDVQEVLSEDIHANSEEPEAVQVESANSETEESDGDSLPDWLRDALSMEKSEDIAFEATDETTGWESSTETTETTDSTIPLEADEREEEYTSKIEEIGDVQVTMETDSTEISESSFPVLDMSELMSKQQPVSEEFMPDTSDQLSEENAEKSEESIEQLFRKEFEVSEEDIPAFHEPVEEEPYGEPAPLDLPEWLRGVDESKDTSVSDTDELRLSELAAELDENQADNETAASESIEEIPVEGEASEPEIVTPVVDTSHSEEMIDTYSTEDQQLSTETEETLTDDTFTPKQEQSASDKITGDAEQQSLETTLQEATSKIQNKQDLEAVIDNLVQLAQEHPADVQVLQTLGDAYFKNNQIQQAIDAYAKAEAALK